jgi:hypothetical protein
VFAANVIVALYSLFELVASVWEISRGATLFPEILQVWFDFGHDQVQTLTLSVCVCVCVIYIYILLILHGIMNQCA